MSSDSNPVSSPVNRSEVIAASEAEPLIAGEVPQEEEPRTIKVFFTTPNGPLEFFHLSSDTTGWDIVTEKGCFAHLETNNLCIAHRSTMGHPSSRIVEHLPGLQEGDTLEFRSSQNVEALHSLRSQPSQSRNSGNQVPDPRSDPPGPAFVRALFSTPRTKMGEAYLSPFTTGVDTARAWEILGHYRDFPALRR